MFHVNFCRLATPTAVPSGASGARGPFAPSPAVEEKDLKTGSAFCRTGRPLPDYFARERVSVWKNATRTSARVILVSVITNM